MDHNRRQNGEANRQWGKVAEQIAMEHLFKEGYSVREREWKCGNHIEIDIIAEKEFMIVFVEVKARKGDHEDPLDAVNNAKRSKMVKGADIYMSNLPMQYQHRFDIITITGTADHHTLEHIEDAFLPPLNGRWQ